MITAILPSDSAPSRVFEVFDVSPQLYKDNKG